MSPELGEIKVMRKKFGLTQNELAKRANVSQSLITKIESNRIDPTYSKAQKIFNVLNSLHERHELKALEIMEKKIIYIKPDASIKEAIKKMRQNNISQMPVVEGNNAVGIVSEAILLDTLMSGKHYSTVKDVMKDSPPIVNQSTNAKAIYSLLHFFPIVLVTCKGKICGVITKTDIIEKLSKS